MSKNRVVLLLAIYFISLTVGRVLVPHGTSPRNCISTGPTCVDDCNGSPDGTLLQTCRNCSSFIQCVFGQPVYLTCPEGLSFDDEFKVCVVESSTCVECEVYPTTQEPPVTDFTTEVSDETSSQLITWTDSDSTADTTETLTEATEDWSDSTTRYGQTEVYGTEPTIIPTDCGTILRGGLNTSTPIGWDTFCYIDRNENDDDINKPCSELLENLLGFYDAADLLANGGNFGCWRSVTHPDDDPNLGFACIENYQHSIVLGACDECKSLSVCVRFPESGAIYDYD